MGRLAAVISIIGPLFFGYLVALAVHSPHAKGTVIADIDGDRPPCAELIRYGRIASKDRGTPPLPYVRPRTLTSAVKVSSWLAREEGGRDFTMIQRDYEAFVEKSASASSFSFAVIAIILTDNHANEEEQFRSIHNSLLIQKHRKWHLFLVLRGDSHLSADTISIFFPPNQSAISVLRLPASIEKSLRFPSCVDISGSLARNFGIDAAERMRYRHLVFLNAENAWSAHHLQVLFETYNAFPRATFVHTRASRAHAFIPSTEEFLQLTGNMAHLESGELILSASSWRQDALPLRFRTTGELYPDRDMWHRLFMRMKQYDFQAVYVPLVTVYEKNVPLEKLSQYTGLLDLL